MACAALAAAGSATQEEASPQQPSAKRCKPEPARRPASKVSHNISARQLHFEHISTPQCWSIVKSAKISARQIGPPSPSEPPDHPHSRVPSVSSTTMDRRRINGPAGTTLPPVFDDVIAQGAKSASGRSRAPDASRKMCRSLFLRSLELG